MRTSPYVLVRKYFNVNAEIFVFVISRLFFLLFLYSAIDKLYDFEKFRIQLGQSPMLTAFAAHIAWAVPTLEVLIAVLLVLHKTTLLGLYASFTIMVTFTAYILVIMNFSEFIPCSCNGILEGFGWTAHLVFNFAFVLIAIAGVLLKIHTDANKKMFNRINETGEAENLSIE